MRAVVIRSFGGPEVLELRELPSLEPPFGHIRIAVKLAGVNRADLLQRAGHYPAPPGVPADIPGLEYVGTVDAVGPSVTRFVGGERVYGIVAGGAYATELIAHEREVVPVPEVLSDEDAAAAPEAFITALDALLTRGRVVPGERVLVHAAGSGVGTAAIQIARALGCFVIGTSRTADKLERCKTLGMDVGIVTDQARFAEDVQKATGGRGVDVVVDLVGGAYFPESLACAAKKARIVLVGLTGGARAETNLGLLLSKRLEVVGTVLRSRPLEEKIAAAEMLDRTLGPWLAKGMLKPIVDRIFPLAEAADAHRFIASNASFGKVLLDARGA